MSFQNFSSFDENIKTIISHENPYITTIMVSLLQSIKKDSNSVVYVNNIVDYFIKLTNNQMFFDDYTDEKYEKYLDGLDKPEYHNSFIELFV